MGRCRVRSARSTPQTYRCGFTVGESKEDHMPDKDDSVADEPIAAEDLEYVAGGAGGSEGLPGKMNSEDNPNDSTDLRMS